MGVTGSVPAAPLAATGVTGGTPSGAPTCASAPRNKHLAHVSDPRSPTAGILRTPIEVVSSPTDSPQPGSAEQAAASAQERDPRSPTPGISRTPMRTPSTDSVDRLVRQLSEAFGAEAASPEPSPTAAAAACPTEEPARQTTPSAPSGDEAERPLSPSAAPSRPARFAGSKPVRPKNNKVMANSGTGRSPLSILLDDNSPSAPASRQGKRHVLGENIGEKREVTVDLNRSLKSGNCAWNDLNKENQQCPFVEN
ncbi:cell division cycle-associated protein 3 [Calypte anna]|uniref:cell division cycle-associated protein 3 n=1 Tax=Calypte anna TaxID=9244 RepID=UPI0011C44FE2|nr:cell division cycle-associated protein 3 [Calypte anna]